MKFYNKIIKTSVDLKPYTSLVIYSLEGCNLNCYECFNREEIIEKKHKVYLSEKEVLDKLKLNGFLVDAVIFSGGEFLISNIDEILNFLAEVRKIFSGYIIIYTNGTFPEKVKKLIELNLVDGFHVDMKLPFHSKILKIDDIEKILGLKMSYNVNKKVLDTVNIVMKHNSPMSQIRTIKYDCLPEIYFNEIELYIKSQNKKNNSNIKYKLNDFIKASYF